MPVWIKNGRSNEPAEEVFCNYRICHTSDKVNRIIRFLKDGYEINLTKQMQNNLLDIKDGGINCLIFVNNDKVKINNAFTTPVIHYVSISNIDAV